MGFGGVGLICDLWLWVCFMVAVGLLVVAVLCWWCCVGVGLCFFFFFWFSYWGLWLWLLGRQWGGVCGSVRVGSRSVGGSMGLLPGFFFLVLTVDYGLVVVVVSSVCSAAVVMIVVVEQK